MTEVRQDSAANEALRQQQALMDQARMEVMNASDKLNRAGIYLMFDKETGSVGSWNSLMSEAETSLANAQGSYQKLERFSGSARNDAAFTDLKNSYQQLYNGLVELAQGIKKNQRNRHFLCRTYSGLPDAVHPEVFPLPTGKRCPSETACSAVIE
ncbi:hypothetical protein OS42_24510 [Dickeya oryzae]